MKLNKQQRHMAYMIMLAEWETEIKKPGCGSLTGFCYFIRIDFDMYLDQFPELANKKPKNIIGAYWFAVCAKEEQRKRIAILKQCIAETYYEF